MKWTGQLVIAEIRHRRLNFLLACLSVAIASGSVVGALAFLRGHDLRSEQAIEQKESAMREEMAHLENDYRIIMRRMGYNVLIIHRDQDLTRMHNLGYPTVGMPDTYADLLAQKSITTLNHLLPVLQHRMKWPEIDQEVLFAGIRGQVPVNGQAFQERTPITSPVPEGSLVLGAALAQTLKASVGSTVTLKGQEFQVDHIHPLRGTADDITVWLALDKVQEWLGMPGKINGILALECICQPDSLGKIQAEVTSILPDVQVLEFSSKVRGRAEARQRAAEAHRTAIAAEKEHRTRMREERRKLTSLLLPLVVAGAALWILLLAWGNVRERRPEIGILRALGFHYRQIFTLFLGKALLIGIAGGLAGCLIGLAWAAAWNAAGPGATEFARLTDPDQLLQALALAPVLSIVASVFPAMMAARQDPANVLRDL